MGRTPEAPLSRNASVVGRLAALTAVAIAIVAVAIILLQGGTTYKVKAIFQNASQIVSGDLVQASGNTIGTVSDISLTPDGQAPLTLNITDSKYQPLRDGTTATVRQASLSGIANRYVDLRLGSAGRPDIKNGGLIGTDHTNSAVDLDQLFNTLDPSTRAALQDVIRGFASSYGGSGTLAQAGWQYLNPALASTSMLFREINRDTNKFTQFVVKTGHLVTDIAARRTDLSGLIVHLGQTTSALASQNVALGQSIQRLPTFMRMANTTFVNLRNALDDLKPLIDDSKPVAPKLQKLLEQLRPLANDAVPTVRDLANIIRRPGANNDLIELTNLSSPLAAVTVRNSRVNGTSRPGAFPQSVDALKRSTPELAVARPYAVDLTGWFDGYSHPGTIDANGSASRVAPVIGALSFQNGTYKPLDPLFRLVYALNVLKFKQGDRCPGSMERGGVYYPESGYPCDPTQVPTGN